MTLDLEQIQEVIHVHLNYKTQHGQESHKKSTTLNFSMEFHNKNIQTQELTRKSTPLKSNDFSI